MTSSRNRRSMIPRIPSVSRALPLSERSRQFVREQERLALEDKKLQGEDRSRFNRMLLEDAYPKETSFYRRYSLYQRQFCRDAHVRGLHLLPDRPIHGRRAPEEVFRPQDAGTLRRAERAGLLLDFLQARLVLDAVRLPELFLHVDHVPDDLRPGHFRSGARAKKASAFIVMAIMGGAVLPKLMGYVADQYDMSRSFIVPMVCFGFVALYGFLWPKLSNAESLHSVSTAKGHSRSPDRDDHATGMIARRGWVQLLTTLRPKAACGS